MILHNFSTVSKVMFLFFFKPSKVLLSKPDFNKWYWEMFFISSVFHNGALGSMIAGIICLAIGGGGVWFALSMDRCPACKKIFAMKPGKREFLGKENVVERKEYNIYNRNHEVTGTYEKDVPVTKLYYYQWYICKYCGHKESETIVK